MKKHVVVQAMFSQQDIAMREPQVNIKTLGDSRKKHRVFWCFSTNIRSE